MISKNILSIGCELEGGADLGFLEGLSHRYSHMQICHDGSVCVDDFPQDDVEVTYWTERKNAFTKFITEIFDGDFGQNDTCGNHIHLKFKNMDKAVALFTMPTTQRMFLREYKKFANTRKSPRKYLNRLHNQYCHARTTEPEIINQFKSRYKDGSRYSIINLNCLKEIGTIEFRVFPHAEDSKEYLDMVAFLSRFINKLFRKGVTYEKTVEFVMPNTEIKDLVVEKGKLSRPNYTYGIPMRN